MHRQIHANSSDEKVLAGLTLNPEIEELSVNPDFRFPSGLPTW
jgi:hypothetical protein